MPITLHPDGRKSHPPHLRTFRDGWRTLRFFLMYSPRGCFWCPESGSCIALGFLGYAVAMPGMHASGRDLRRAHAAVREPGAHLRLPIHPVRACSPRSSRSSEGLLPEDRRLTWLSRSLTLEKGLLIGALAFVAGWRC